jgi:hypothetical protein
VWELSVLTGWAKWQQLPMLSINRKRINLHVTTQAAIPLAEPSPNSSTIFSELRTWCLPSDNISVTCAARRKGLSYNSRTITGGVCGRQTTNLWRRSGRAGSIS